MHMELKDVQAARAAIARAHQLLGHRRRAGHPMLARLDQLKIAICNIWESIIDESNKASGSTGKIAKSLMGLNHTIESNRDNIQNLLSSLVTLGARFVEVSVHLGEFILKMPTWVKDLGVAVASTMAFASTFKTLSAASSLILSVFVSFVGVQ